MSCARLWEVSAARDGQLAAADRASHARHAAQCEACRAEAARLERLADALAELPVPAPNDVAARRARLRLLAAAHGKAERAVRPRAWLAVAAVLLLAIGLGVSFRALRGRPPVVTATTRAVDIRPGPGARWTQRPVGGVRRVELQDGELTIEVVHQEPFERVLVMLPDGVLEDVGTRFVVEVREGHTRRVVVHEGAVVLRLNGRAPIDLGAGGVWTWSPLSAPEPATSVAALVSASATTASVAVAPPAPTAKAPAAKAPDVAPDPAALELKAAMAALRAGEHADAAQRFSAFVASHPGHPQAEDASWLRVVAAQRGGDTAGACTAAKDYLARFPKGFRRPEADALSGC